MIRIISITLVLSFYYFFGMDYCSNNKYSNSCSIKTISCPPHNEKAKEALQEYLAKENTIDVLRENYSVKIDIFTQNKIVALEQDECKKLIAQFDWLETYEFYSFYKFSEHYFIVPFSLTEKKEFELQPITLVNKDFEVIAVVIDFEKGKRNQ